MANELGASRVGSTISMLCGAADVADSLLVTEGTAGFVVATANASYIAGVTVGAATAATQCRIALPGQIVTLTTTAAAVAVGDELTCATGGKVLKQTTTATTYAVALSAVGSGGGTILAYILPTPIANPGE